MGTGGALGAVYSFIHSLQCNKYVNYEAREAQSTNGSARDEASKANASPNA